MAAQSEEIVGFMKNPASYPECPSSVRFIETHISWVFLTDRHAYKLKKPVRFEFLDFSTVELRHNACHEELRLNRRLAPTVYIDVLAITQSAEGFRLGGDGDVIDWVVQMRRLPNEIALDAKVRNGSITAEQETAVTHYLSSFYAQLQPESISPDSYRQSLERHIRANRDALTSGLPNVRARIRSVHGSQLRFLHIERAVMDERVTSGRVVDGHGDLRPEHIYLETPPAIIDCIEFSKELRQVDVADELSFLDMECLRLGNASMGRLAIATYQRECSDEIPPRLLDFYRSYRACVRAKVAVLRRQQETATNQLAGRALEMQYLDLAECFSAKLGPPCVLIVGGLIGTGKSTVARTIADALGAELLSTDAIRRSQLGASQSLTGYGEGNYRPELRSQIYDALTSQADSLLNDKLSVILDGTFLAQNHRSQVYDLAARHGAVCLFLLCRCDRNTALSRIKERSRIGASESEARAEFYDQQLREFEPPRADEPTVMVDTTQVIPQQLYAVYTVLRQMLFGLAKST